MKTDKKRQHYVPKFYLKNFSYQNNKTQIGVFNINNSLFIQKAPIKSQGYKKFYYGDDGIVEEALSKIEGQLASVTKNIIETKTLPAKNSDDYDNLLRFVTLTDLRNPVKIDGTKSAINEMRDKIMELAPNTDTDRFVPRISHEEAIKMAISHIESTKMMITDLECKIVLNSTQIPFISSDFPIIKYNQYLESKRWPASKTGYGLTGLQIFVPLNSQIILFFLIQAYIS